MTRLTAYMLRQIAGPFLFFVLVFTGVIWLSQSLRIIDTVVNNGQSALVFLEFTALLLPRVMTIVLPVAGFAATLYAINRLYTDSEIAVMFAAGMSSLRLFRPVVLFSGMLLATLLVISLWIVPASQRELRDRMTEVRGDIATAFIREGTFMSPARGISVYVRDTGEPGELSGLFIHDTRDPEQITTHTAERAVMLRDETGPRLVMLDGFTQIASTRTPDTISVLRFDQIVYDLGQLAGEEADRNRKPSELYLPRLLTITAEEAAAAGRPLGEYRAEAHEALSSPLYMLALPMLGVAILINAGFRRQGFFGRIVLSCVTAVFLRVVGLAAKSAVAGEAAFWPLLYVPPTIGILVALWLMSARAVPHGQAGADRSEARA